MFVKNISIFLSNSKNKLFYYLARPCFREEAQENSSSTVKPRFVPTKWQTIDPSNVTAQGNVLKSI